MSIQISIIIPTRGRFDSLCRAINSVRQQDCHSTTEIIVIDDASDPKLPVMPPDIKVVSFDYSVGACKARNSGVSIAQGEFLLFMDDDAELISSSVLRRAAKWFIGCPRLGAVGFRQLKPDGQVHFMQPINSENPARTGLFYSYACIVRKEAYCTVNGFNELFGYYFEEVEFCLKLFSAQYQVVYDPNLLAVHHEDNRFRNWDKIFRQTTRNAILSYMLHYPACILPILVLKRLFLFARMSGRLFFPRISDVLWLFGELIRLRSEIWRNRKPLPWSVVREFSRVCKKGDPIESPPISKE